MIEPMVKYSFLVYHKDYQQFLTGIRDHGVLHIIEAGNDIPDEITNLFGQIKEVDGIIKMLSKRKVEKSLSPNGLSGPEALRIAKKAAEQLEQLQLQFNALKKEISIAQPWGLFTRFLIEQLKEHGIIIKGYSISSRDFDPDWLQIYPIQKISEDSGQVYFVTFNRVNEEIEIPGTDEVRIPEKPVSELVIIKEQLESRIKEINSQLDGVAAQNLGAISDYHKHLIESAEFDKAVLNTTHKFDNSVMLLEGWVPGKKSKDLESYLDAKSVLFICRKANQDDNVPVLLKNNKFSKKFEMIGGLYSLPRYGELDLTPFFAPFYTIFFGFCLGDAGYGLLMAIAAIILKPRVRHELKPVLGLVFYLALSTIIFGLIGGTFFGIPLYETSLPVYSTLYAAFEARGTDISNILFQLSLGLGAVQILFGMVLKAVNESKQFGWKMAISTIGWIILLVGSVIIYGIGTYTPIPEANLQPAWYILFSVSGIMILLLNNMNRNIIHNFGFGLWNTYNMITGLIGDLLSYIRLFALGISSAILGFVFNSLAVSLSGDIPVISTIIMIIILVVGHSINLFMAGLGSFVHPLRLTFVEFYKNAGFSGGGKKYNPLKKLT